MCQVSHQGQLSKCAFTSILTLPCSGGCGTFYAIAIASDMFKGLSMVKQHKLVQEELKKEIEGIHGLQVRVSCSVVECAGKLSFLLHKIKTSVDA